MLSGRCAAGIGIGDLVDDIPRLFLQVLEIGKDRLEFILMIPPCNDIGSVRLGILMCRCEQLTGISEPGNLQLGSLAKIETFEFPGMILPDIRNFIMTVMQSP